MDSLKYPATACLTWNTGIFHHEDPEEKKITKKKNSIPLLLVVTPSGV